MRAVEVSFSVVDLQVCSRLLLDSLQLLAANTKQLALQQQDSRVTPRAAWTKVACA
jgi:hypothetical protein